MTLADDGYGETLRYRLLSSTAWFFLVFALVWNTGISVFFIHLIPLQELAPLLFMIPFVAMGVGMAVAALVQLFGHVEVRCRDEGLELFTGIGTVGRTRRIRFDEIAKVAVRPSDISSNNRRLDGVGIELASGKTLWLLRGAKPERQEYVVNFLRTLVARAKH